VDEIVADGVTPVLPRIFRLICLVEKVPASLPEGKTIRVVQSPFRVDVVVDRPVWIRLEFLPRRLEPKQEWIGAQLRFLLLQSIPERVTGHLRSEVRLDLLCWNAVGQNKTGDDQSDGYSG